MGRRFGRTPARWVAVGAFLVIGLTSAGCSNALVGGASSARLESTATSAGPGNSEPDAVVRRVFPDAAGISTICTISMWAVPDEQSAGADADARVARAKAFLHDGDWASVPVALTDIPADQRDGMAQQGRTEPDVLISRLDERIGGDLMAAGLTGDGVSTTAHVGCDQPVG